MSQVAHLSHLTDHSGAFYFSACVFPDIYWFLFICKPVNLLPPPFLHCSNLISFLSPPPPLSSPYLFTFCFFVFLFLLTSPPVFLVSFSLPFSHLSFLHRLSSTPLSCCLLFVAPLFFFATFPSSPFPLCSPLSLCLASPLPSFPLVSLSSFLFSSSFLLSSCFLWFFPLFLFPPLLLFPPLRSSPLASSFPALLAPLSSMSFCVNSLRVNCLQQTFLSVYHAAFRHVMTLCELLIGSLWTAVWWSRGPARCTWTGLTTLTCSSRNPVWPRLLLQPWDPLQSKEEPFYCL